MKIISATILIFLSIACQTAPEKSPPKTDTAAAPKPAVDTTKLNALTISPSAFNGAAEQFQSHETYLSMTLPYPAFANLLAQLEQRETGIKLENRGEAHITVLSPPELTILKTRLSLIDINAAAQKIGIQTTEVEPICVGEGKAKVDGVEQRTFYVVVHAQNLLRIRRDLERMFVSYGGNKKKFKADQFYPHVTLGFTKTDLFEEQGVVKNENSCKYSIVEMGAQR